MSDTTPPGPPVTTLRVYEPLEAFPPAERRRWVSYLRRAPSTDSVATHERREAWRRVVAGARATVPPGETPLARVVEVSGVPLLCPLQLRLRCAAAAREAVRTLPPSVVTAALTRAGVTSETGDVPAGVPQDRAPQDPVPQQVPDVGADTGPGTGRGVGPGLGPDRRLRTLVSVWDVPWGWLVLVRPEDRRPDGGYLVPMAAARARAARALRSLREGVGATTVTGDVEDVARWLEDFHPRSVVELDDTPVALILGDVGADDVRLGLAALAAGETEAVAAAYRRLSARGDRLRLLSHSS